MSYADEFKTAATSGHGNESPFRKLAPAILQYTFSYNQVHIYDFLNRVRVTTARTSNYNEAGIAMTTTEFAQLDRDVLQAMRAKLIELSGKPPALPSRHDFTDEREISKPQRTMPDV